MPNRTSDEQIFNGLGVSHGIAMGRGYVIALDHPNVAESKLDQSEIESELARFDAAVEKAHAEVLAIRAKITGDDDITVLLDAHGAMLAGSRLVRGARARIEKEAVNAEAAVDHEVDSLAAQFRALNDAYIASKADDVAAVGNRIIRALTGISYLALSGVPKGGIVLAHDISPADAALLDPQQFAGLATVHGGAAGHTAVVARGLGLPAVLGLPMAFLEAAASAQDVIVDGISGLVIINPTQKTRDAYAAKLADLQKVQQSLAALAAEPAHSAEGIAITLRANLELLRETDAILASGANGIGLFRTEFLYMNRAGLPDEDTQFEAMAQVVQAMKGESVTFRTLDIGGDKLAKSLGHYIAETPNPALGLRAIRLSLKQPHLLQTQFRAILRAGYFGPVRILLPMVTTASEVMQAKRLLAECYKDLKEKGIAVCAALPPLGTMIEIPAAALAADSLAAVSDFFALGTNDLVQYTVAIDRGDDQVAALYNPLNPAVLRLMKFTIEAGTRAGLPVSICGEMAADPKYTALLLGLGLRELSVGHANVPRIKQKIKTVDLEKATAHANYVLDQYDPEKIAAIVASFEAI